MDKPAVHIANIIEKRWEIGPDKANFDWNWKLSDFANTRVVVESFTVCVYVRYNGAETDKRMEDFEG